MKPKDCRTYRDLLQHEPSDYSGTCCACHKWGREVWRISTRASICRTCIERKGDTVLGSILKAERHARRIIKNHPSVCDNPQFLARLTGASLEFVNIEVARQKAMQP